MLKAALKSLLGRKLRLLMSTFAIVLGVAFVVGTLIFSDTLNRSFTAIFASTVGDVVVRPVGGTAEDGSPTTITIPASVTDQLEKVDGAARVDGNVSAIGVYVIGKDDKIVGGNGPPAFGASYNDAPAGHGIEGLVVTEGRPPMRAGEVVLDAKTAEEADYVIGEQIKIVSAADEALIQPRLVGVAEFGEGGSLNGASLSMFETKAAQDLFLDGKDAYNDIWVTAEDGVSQDELRDRVQAVLPDDYEAITGDDLADENASELLEALTFITTFLLIFAGISLVVGSFLIVNTFSILVAQRSRELALLRALGASKRQVTRSVMLEACVVGAVGSTLGLGLGIGLAYGLRAAFATQGLDLSGSPMIFASRTVLAAYAVGMLVTIVAAYLPARRTTKIPPIAALRDDVAMPESSLRIRLLTGAAMIAAGVAAMGAGLFADIPRAGWFVGGGVLFVLLGVAAASPVLSKPFLGVARWAYAKAFGSIGNLAGQNSLRNPRRTSATASALMIGLALCTTMAITGASAKASVDETIARLFVGDYVVSNLLGEGFSPRITRDVSAVEGVGSTTRLRFGLGEVEGERVGITGIDPDTITSGLRLEMEAGALSDLRDGTVLLSEERRSELGVEVGDEVAVDVPSGTEKYAVAGIYRDNELLSSGYVSTVQTLVDAGFRDADNILLVDVAPGADRAAVGAELEKVVEKLPTVSVKDQQGLAEEPRGQIDRLLTIVYILLGLALVIAVLGIINTLALSIIERTREVGLLRAIGVSRGQLHAMVTLESVVISVLGALLGVILGVAFGIALMYSLRDQGLEIIKIPVGQLALFLGSSLVIGVLAAVFPARRAARLDVLRAIATE